MIPLISHVQLATLRVLLDGDGHWGRDLRAALRDDGWSSSNASFYEMMDRMVALGLVEKERVGREVLGQSVKEARYRITAAGDAAWRDAVAYYLGKSGA